MNNTCNFLRMARCASLAVWAGLMLAGCQHLPDSLSSVPLLQSSAADARALAAELPPAPERDWPVVDHDVINIGAQGHGLVHMPAMQSYLNGLLARIKQEAGVPGWPG